MLKDKKKKTNNWGSRLRSVLKEKNVSLRRAADIARVAASVIDNWANGSSPEDLLAVKRLSDHLGISFCWLLTGEHEDGARKLSIAEQYEEAPYFEGLARIKIERLIPRKNVSDENE